MFGPVIRFNIRCCRLHFVTLHFCQEMINLRKITCDVAIIGAGPAGLAAAVEVSSRGLNAAVFDKRNKTGGLRNGGIGPFAVESALQEQSFVDLSKEQAFNYMMEFTHWTTDARLVSEFINLSADTIDWLSGMGVEFQSVTAYYKGGKQTQHNFDHKARNIAQVLTEEAQRLGVEFYLETTVQSLTEKDGAVVGLTAVDCRGEAVAVDAKAVVVASGGFSGDPELVQKAGYTMGKDIKYTFDMSETCGDGLRMIWAVGGQKAPMMMDTYVGLTSGYGGPLGTAPALACLRQPVNLMVNQKGQRFMREDLCTNPGYTGNAVHHQYGGCGISILDETMYQEYQEQQRLHPSGPPKTESDPEHPREPEPFERFDGIPMDQIIQEARQEGCADFFMADSLEDFARQAELPLETLKETIEEYNSMCEKRADTIFYKASKYLHPICGPKYYGARFFCDTYGGLGGVRINHKAQVLNNAEDPIPGLYCAGNDANTIYGNSYPFYLCGNTSSFALNTGRMAGKSICQELL